MKTHQTSEMKNGNAENSEMRMDMNARTPTKTLVPDPDPEYPIGTSVTVLADHMPGMKGARGKVTGAFDTIAYAVTFTSEDGQMHSNHKWVITEEIEGGAGKMLQSGQKIKLSAGHIALMAGKGTKAVITDVEPGPVYMIDYDAADGSGTIFNHQWVVEKELEPAEK